MINIPLVYDSDDPNIWIPVRDDLDQYDQHYSVKFKRQMPWLLQTFQPMLSVIKPDDIDSVEWFIYPVLMTEPFFQIRSLILNHHRDFGFWSFVSDKVIESLKAKKGWILIDATMEPLKTQDLELIIKELSKPSQFPNDRIIINAPANVKHSQVVNLSSFLETHFCCRHLFSVPDDYKLAGGKLSRGDIYVPKWNETEPPTSSRVDLEPRRFCSFQMRWWKHQGCAHLLALLSKLNYFKKGYVTADGIEDFEELFYSVRHKDYRILQLGDEPGRLENKEDIIPPVEYLHSYILAAGFNAVTEAYYDELDLDFVMITEKIWRNIANRKPFVVIGQKHTLKKFHSLGYKSFHPLIDESYDNRADSSRFHYAFAEIQKLINMSDESFDKFLQDVSHIHDHNSKNFEHRVTKSYSYFKDLRNKCL